MFRVGIVSDFLLIVHVRVLFAVVPSLQEVFVVFFKPAYAVNVPAFVE